MSHEEEKEFILNYHPEAEKEINQATKIEVTKIYKEVFNYISNQ